MIMLTRVGRVAAITVTIAAYIYIYCTYICWLAIIKKTKLCA